MKSGIAAVVILAFSTSEGAQTITNESQAVQLRASWAARLATAETQVKSKRVELAEVQEEIAALKKRESQVREVKIKINGKEVKRTLLGNADGSGQMALKELNVKQLALQAELKRIEPQEVEARRQVALWDSTLDSIRQAAAAKAAQIAATNAAPIVAQPKQPGEKPAAANAPLKEISRPVEQPQKPQAVAVKSAPVTESQPQSGLLVGACIAAGALGFFVLVCLKWRFP